MIRPRLIISIDFVDWVPRRHTLFDQIDDARVGRFGIVVRVEKKWVLPPPPSTSIVQAPKCDAFNDIFMLLEDGKQLGVVFGLCVQVFERRRRTASKSTPTELSTRLTTNRNIKFGDAYLQSQRCVVRDRLFDVLKRNSSASPVSLNANGINGSTIIEKSFQKNHRACMFRSRFDVVVVVVQDGIGICVAGILERQCEKLWPKRLQPI